MLIVVLIFVFVSFDPAKFLFITFLLYMVSGPGFALLRRIRKRRHRSNQ
jgi:hypothetical protein